MRDLAADAAGGIERAIEHLRLLQQVNRATTSETPIGPALDLEASSQAIGLLAS